MKFFVNNIADYSAKAYKLTLVFVETGTLLDGCSVNVFAPKSVELIMNEVNDIPYFIARNAFCGFSYKDNLKCLGNQLTAKAPKGKKREYKNMAAGLLEQVSAMNIETPVEATGNFVGEKGQNMILKLTAVQLLSDHTYTDDTRWTHKPGYDGSYNWVHPEYTQYVYKLTDDAENIFILKTYSKKIANMLSDNIGKELIIDAVITEHKIFHDVRQTIIKNCKILDKTTIKAEND